MKIQVQESESGDWVRLVVDGEVIAESHQIDDHHWARLLRTLGAEVEFTRHEEEFFVR